MRQKKIKPVERVLNRQLNKCETLEEKTSKVKTAHIPQSEEEVIEEMIGELKVSCNYQVLEKDLKKQLKDEKDALELGIKSDNYYTAKQKEDEEDSLGETEENSGSMGSRRS